MAVTSLQFDILAKDKASPTLDKVGKKMDGLSTKSVAFGSFIGNAMTGAVGALGRMGVAAAKMGISTAAGLEQAQVGFTTLIGSGQKAQKFLAQLQQFAAATPFELPGLIDSSRLLLGVGVNADKVIPMLTAFGDAAGAVGVGQEAFQRIILATSQAISAGRFQVGDLNQIVTNGIPAWKLLSEATGKPVPVLRDLASKGKLLSKDVLPALQRQMEKDYGGAMAKQSKTLAGVWSTLMDTINIGLAQVLKPLVPVLEQVVPQAANVLQGAFTATGKAIDVFVTAFSGRSEINEFNGGLKTVNNAAITLREGLDKTIQAVTIFWNAFNNRSEVNEFDGGMKKVNNAAITAREVYDTAKTVIKAFVDQLAVSIGFLDRHRAILKTTAGIVLALVAVTKAYNLALAVQSAGGVAKWLWEAAKAWRAVQLATEAATAVQWAYNVALDANPIGLIIVAIGALVAALVVLWRENDTFRRIVTKAWHAITDAVSAAVDWITGTAWPALVAAWGAVSGAAETLWHSMVAIWDGIVSAVAAGVAGVMAVVRGIGDGFDAVGHGFAVVGRVFAGIGSAIAEALAPVGAAFLWLYRAAQPVFDFFDVQWQIFERFAEIAVKSVQIEIIVMGRLFNWLGGIAATAFRAVGEATAWLGGVAMKGLRAAGDAATWLYANAIKPSMDAVGAALRAVGGWFVWLWQKAGVPALHGIEAGVRAVGAASVWLYRVGIAPVFSAIGSVIQVAWSKGIRPALSAITGAMRALGDAVSTVWRKVLLPTFGALKDFVADKVAPAFAAGVRAIRKAWDSVQDAAKAPVRFVVDTVINQGIIGTFNKVAGYFGVGKVDTVHLPKGFASGGVVNTPTAIVGEGGPDPEYVIPTDRKHRKRALALYADLGTQLLASGGIVGWLRDPVGSMRNAVTPFLDRLTSIGRSPIGQLAAGVPRKLAGGVGHFLLSHLADIGSSLTGGGGSAAVRRVGQRLAAQAGWGSAGEWQALDALWTHESGWNPAAKNPTSTAFGIPQFLKSTASAYGLAYGSVDPVAQIKAGLKYIRDVYGDPINAWRLWQSRSPHWYGAGGTITEPIIGTGLRTGRSYGFGEHGPETVIPGRRGGDGEVHLHIHNHGVIGSKRETNDWLAGALDDLRRSNRLPRSLRT